MKIRFSVFTTKLGYEWSNIPSGISEASLGRYETLVTNVRPEYMKVGQCFDGVFLDGDTVVVFRALRVPNWDIAKRTAHYYSFAFIPRSECVLVDIGALLLMHEFSTPMKDPPSVIEYNGPQSKSVSRDDIELIKSGHMSDMDFSCCGDLLCNYWRLGTKWQMFRTNVNTWSGAKFVFEPNCMRDMRQRPVSPIYSPVSARQGAISGMNYDRPQQSSPSPEVIKAFDDKLLQLECRINSAIEGVRRVQNTNNYKIENLALELSNQKRFSRILLAIAAGLLIFVVGEKVRVIDQIKSVLGICDSRTVCIQESRMSKVASGEPNCPEAGGTGDNSRVEVLKTNSGVGANVDAGSETNSQGQCAEKEIRTAEVKKKDDAESTNVIAGAKFKKGK